MSSFAELARGECRDPFSFLGIHPDGEGGWVIRVFLPWASKVEALIDGTRIPMKRSGRPRGGWKVRVPAGGGKGAGHGSVPPRYRLVVRDGSGNEWFREDPYRFGPIVDEERVHRFLSGDERRLHDVLGCRRTEAEGVKGTHFSVWAPHARAVHVTGDLNGWDPRCSPMRPRGATGVWELFVPDAPSGGRYKYEVWTSNGERIEKADPLARAAEVRPRTASIIPHPSAFRWTDEEWMASRSGRHAPGAPISIYEVHPGSWRRNGDGSWLGWYDLSEQLLPYVKEMGFTHVELLPITEHPLDQSWGYQPLGFFAPTSRFGGPDDLRGFINRAHELGIGVILDWVPGHFAQDPHGLGRFDGTPLYEHWDDRQAWHPDWGTLTFDYGKTPVRNFLTSSALHWIEDFHFDGLRVDAVASMLYLDYSREEGEWLPNREGGNVSLEAVDFLRHMNHVVHERHPDVLTIAEESTAWDGVTRPTFDGGLGFDLKWNMGWMNDTLSFMEEDPVHRKYHFGKATFSIVYAWSERYLLPLSHDEVVHGKGSLLRKMPGHDPEKFAQLRTLLTWQWMHPGKKLLFMGCELAQWGEWDVDGSVDWALEGFDAHAGVRRLVTDLNRLQREHPALHALDGSDEGFEWLDMDRPEDTTLSFLRWGPGWTDPLVVVVNLTPVHRDAYPVPVPFGGGWRVILNSGAPVYGGPGHFVPEVLHAEDTPMNGRDFTLKVPLPGLSVLVFERAE